MHYSTILTTALIATANVARADWLDDEDVPSQCNDVCRPVVEASDRCEDQFDDDDDQRNCICTTANFNTIIPNCELCIRNSSDDEDEIRDLRQDCGLPNPTGSATRSAQSTPSVTTSTSMATVTQGGGTTVSPSVVTVTPTSGGSQSTPTSGSSNNDDNNNNNSNNQNGAGTQIASVVTAGLVAIGAVLAALF